SPTFLRPPSSTPFPYTTLFRSPHPVRHRGGDPGTRPAAQEHAPHAGFPAATDRLRRSRRPGRGGRRPRSPHGGRPRLRLETVVQDRKSTRLNSSHVKISYAVFC